MQTKIICIISVVLVSAVAFSPQKSCNIQEEQYGYVCVNTEEHCDSLDVPEDVGSNQFLIVTSSKYKERFVYKIGEFNRGKSSKILLEIDPSVHFQKMKGFGGGYTGSVTEIIDRLSPKLRKCLFKSYFSRDFGMGYNYLRVPIGGCDFDLSPWAYNEYPENDANLSNFTQLDHRDVKRNNQLKEMMHCSNNYDVKLLGVSWGPPKWMKEQDDWNGGVDNKLKRECYQTWADYHLKWLDLMHKDNMSVWGLSTGNEPVSARQIKFQSLYWQPADQACWITNNLGPTLKNSDYANVQIHGFDDNRDLGPEFIGEMEKANCKAFDYISGLEFHAYSDKAMEPEVLDNFQDKFPDKEIWYSEMCFGAWFMTKYVGPRLGTWNRAQSLVRILVENLSHSTVGYIDWNFVLDHTGGPSYFNNHIDAQIIVSEDYKELYKQPTFYAMAHFSKFIWPGSIRIGTHLHGVKRGILSLAFQRPDKKIVVIVSNGFNKALPLSIRDTAGTKINIRLKRKSINTIVYSTEHGKSGKNEQNDKNVMHGKNGKHGKNRNKSKGTN